MNVGRPTYAMTPRVADFVNAAAARHRGDDAALPRSLAPRPSEAALRPDLLQRDGAERVGWPGGYFDALDLDLSAPAPLDRSTALAAATRALRIQASARGHAPGRMLEDVEITPHERLPSRNGTDARSALSTSIRVTTESGRAVAVDMHIARSDERRWQISAFDSASAGPGPFPYAAPPLFVTTAEFDPLRAEFIGAGAFASVAAPRALPMASGFASPGFRSIGTALALTTICGVMLLSRGNWPLVGATAIVGGVIALRMLLRKAA